jgi:murein DD-endopeptidase MepM/ murein hydrolase activator NlpD
VSDWIRPVNLPVSSGYGMRPGGFHYGIDFSDGVSGHPIHAIADGQVTYRAFEAGGFGNTVTLTHWNQGGIKSGYGHMREPAIVAYGTFVNQGDVLGYIDNTGYSFGPHLHLWMGSAPNPPGVVDPSPYVLGAPLPGPGPAPGPGPGPDNEGRKNPSMWIAWITDINWCDVYYAGVLVDGFTNDDNPVFGVGTKLKRYLDGGASWTAYKDEATYAPTRDRLLKAATA